MWPILQQVQAQDYFAGTSEIQSVRELCQVAHGQLGLGPAVHIRTDSRFFRPTEVGLPLSEPSEARRQQGWKTAVTIEEMVITTVEADQKRLQTENLFPQVRHRQGRGRQHPTGTQ